MSASGVAFVIAASVSTIARLRFETCGDELSQCVYAGQKLQLQRREMFKAAGGASARRAVNNVFVDAAEYLVIWRSVEEGIGQGFVGRGLRMDSQLCVSASVAYCEQSLKSLFCVVLLAISESAIPERNMKQRLRN